MRHAPFCALGLLALTLATACSGADWPGAGGQRATHVPIVAGRAGGDVVVRRPAQQLAVLLADLPPGFTVAEELKPALDGTAAQDPWGRLSAYAVTYVPGSPAAGALDGWGDVVSSVNAYVGTAQAASAFATWRSAVPSQYRLVDDAPA